MVFEFSGVACRVASFVKSGMVEVGVSRIEVGRRLDYFEREGLR